MRDKRDCLAALECRATLKVASMLLEETRHLGRLRRAEGLSDRAAVLDAVPTAQSRTYRAV